MPQTLRRSAQDLEDWEEVVGWVRKQLQLGMRDLSPQDAAPWLAQLQASLDDAQQLLPVDL